MPHAWPVLDLPEKSRAADRASQCCACRLGGGCCPAAECADPCRADHPAMGGSVWRSLPVQVRCLHLTWILYAPVQKATCAEWQVIPSARQLLTPLQPAWALCTPSIVDATGPMAALPLSWLADCCKTQAWLCAAQSQPSAYTSCWSLTSSAYSKGPWFTVIKSTV